MRLVNKPSRTFVVRFVDRFPQHRSPSAIVQEPFDSFPQIAPLAPLALSDSDALMHTFAASYCPSPMAFSRKQVLAAYWRLFSQWLIEMYFKPEVGIRERVKLWALCNTWEHDPMDLEEFAYA